MILRDTHGEQSIGMIKHRTLWLLLVILIALGTSVTGQPPAIKLDRLRFRQLLPEDGLPSQMATNAVEDKYGLIWVATSRGLCRFDGHDFKVYKNNPNDPNSITHDNVRTLATDSKGNLWVGLLTHGLCRYDYATGKFKRYRHQTSSDNSLVHDMVLHIYEDSKGFIWIATEQGLSILDPESGKFRNYRHDKNDPNSIGAGGLLRVAEDAQKRIWITSWSGGINLAVPTETGGYFFRKFNPFDIEHYWALYLDSSNRFWVGTFGDGLLLMQTDDTQSLEKLEPKFIQFQNDKNSGKSLSSNMVVDIEEDPQGLIWLSTTVGLNVFNPVDLKPASMSTQQLEQQKNHVVFKCFKHKYDAVSSLPSPMVLGVNNTRSGAMWVCTPSGIAIFEPKKQAFWPFYFERGEADKYVTFASSAEDDKGRFWFGTQFAGLYIYDPLSDQFTPAKEILPKRLCDAMGNTVLSLYNQNDKFIYAGCETGFFKINLKDYSFTMINGKDEGGLARSQAAKSIQRIFEDAAGNLWLGSTSGLLRYLPKNGKLEFWSTKQPMKENISHDIITGITEDKHGTIWVSHRLGVEKVIRDTKGEVASFKNYSYSANNPYSIAGNHASGICFVNGHIYVSSNGGISKMVEDGKFVTLKNGSLPMDFAVLGIRPGRSKYLWGTTNSAIFSYDTALNKFRFFDRNDGLHGSDFIEGSGCMAHDGSILFFGHTGVTQFQELDINFKEENRHVVLTDFLVDNKAVEGISDPLSIKELWLNHKQNYLSFQFSSLDFLHPKNVSYAYKLEGFDKDWTYCGMHNNAIYSHLHGGDYVFKVKSTNSNGVWSNEASLNIPVHIALPFWKTFWFYSFLALVILLSIYLAIRLRIHAISKHNKLLLQHNEALNREVEERKKVEATLLNANKELTRSNYDLEQFAYIASHDLQEPLRMVGNFVQLIDRRFHDKLDDSGKMYIQYTVEGVTRMSELIHSILAFSRVGRKEIILKRVPVMEIIDKVLGNLAKLLEDKDVELSISNMPNEILCEPDQLGMVLHNLITNAVKFNKNTKPTIRINCEDQGDQWCFSVSDNGIGIDPIYQQKIFEIFKRLHNRTEYEGNGIGLSICKRIIGRHGGHIWFESEEGKGTTFFFTIKKIIEAR